MKNRLFLFFVLAAFVLSVALPASTVFAAGKTVTLSEFKHEPGKGWTAIFKIKGDWKAADLKGNTITVGGKTYNLYCNFRDDDHVSCTMHHDLGLNIGKSASLFFGGQTFGGTVPEKRICNTWYAKWLYAEGAGAEIWTSSWEYWFYYNYVLNGNITYGNDTPIPAPYFYFEEFYDTFYVLSADPKVAPPAPNVYAYYYELFQYSDRHCSAAEYTHKEAKMEVESSSTDFGMGYCEEGDCEEFEASIECDEDGCWECIDGECEYYPGGIDPDFGASE